MSADSCTIAEWSLDNLDRKILFIATSDLWCVFSCLPFFYIYFWQQDDINGNVILVSWGWTLIFKIFFSQKMNWVSRKNDKCVRHEYYLKIVGRRMQFFVLSLYLQKYFRTINYRVEYYYFLIKNGFLTNLGKQCGHKGKCN